MPPPQLPADILGLLNGGIPQMPGGFLRSDDPDQGMPEEAIEVAFEEEADPVYGLDADGNVTEVVPDPDQMSAASPPEHSVNLAEDMDEDVLTRIAVDLIDQVETDIEAREPHMARFKTGLEMMGMIPDTMDDGAFPGASTVTHPLISEAIVQFWARALAEQVPSDGPAKSKVMGKQTQATIERGRRVETYLNHEMLFVDDAWYAEHSRAMFAVPFAGDAFKKVYRDPVLQRNVSIYVPAEDFIVPSNVSDLRSAPRFTHRIWRSRNELKKIQAAGVYRKCDLRPPSAEDLTEASRLRLEAMDVEPSDDDEDARHELYEVNVEYDLPGFEDPAGVGLPYLITIDKASSKVLSIYRAWKADDPLRRRRIQWVQYSYVPGLGFYHMGLFHLIGGLQQAATGALRALLDGSATASLQGGFVARDANLKEQRLEIEPGVWKPVDATSEDLNKAFFTPPFKEPSAALANVLTFLTERAEKVASTTELLTGDTNTKGAPVGSTIAVIEQGQKVFSTIHRGLHMAMAQELRLRMELVQEYMPAEGYPYDVDGAHEGILADDFAPGVSIQPVSDPNIFSSAQRVALAQATYDLATQNPDLVKRDVAIRRVFEAIKVPDIDALLITNEPPPPMDPVSEIQALLRGEPVQAYPDQMHDAHIQHMMAFAQNPGFGGNPEVMKQVGPAFLSLMGQRLAYQWATHARALGAPAPLLPPPIQGQGEQAEGMMPGVAGQAMQGGPMITPDGQPVAPPEVIAQVAAQIAPQMAQVPGLPMPADPAAQQASEEMALKREEMQGQKEERAAERALKERELTAKENEARAKQMALEQEEARKAEAYAMEMKQKDEAHRAKMAAEQQRVATDIEKAEVDRVNRAKQAEHDDFVRAKAAEKAEADAVAAAIEAERKANEAVAQDNERTSTNAQLMQMMTVMDGLAKAIRAPKKLVRDPVTNRAIGTVSVDIDGEGQPEPAKPKARRRKGDA